LIEPSAVQSAYGGRGEPAKGVRILAEEPAPFPLHGRCAKGLSMPRVCALRTRARDLLSRQNVDDGTLADIVPTEDGEVLEDTVRDEPANAIPEEGFREEKGAREAVHVVPTPEQLLRRLGLGFASKEAGPRIGAVQGIKIAHELREQLLMRHSLVSLRRRCARSHSSTPSAR